MMEFYLFFILILVKMMSMSSLIINESVIFSASKYILQYRGANNIGPFQIIKSRLAPFTTEQCPYQNCLVTSDENLLGDIKKFDVVAFHGVSMLDFKLTDIPKERSLKQKYVYVNMESGQNFPVCKAEFNDFFNWTWTYRLDSDIPSPYIAIRNISGGLIGPKENMKWLSISQMRPLTKEIKSKLSSKTKAGAWLVSHCVTISDRHIFVENIENSLKKYGLKVDIYGRCNAKPILRNGIKNYEEVLRRDYYFYFAFENSFDKDYVTEKLLRALNNYVVPIVFGGADYSRFLPPGTYLDGRKLGAGALAKEMNDLIKNKTRYFNMHRWRNHYKYSDGRDGVDSDDRCKLCAMLNDDIITNTVTTKRDLANWWSSPGICASRFIGEKIKPMIPIMTRNLFRRIFAKLKN